MQTPKFNIGDVVTYTDRFYTYIFSVDNIEIDKETKKVYYYNWKMRVCGEDLNLYQKSSPSSPETPIVNKQDFWEAIEIAKSLYTEYWINQKVYKWRYHNKYWRLLSILSSK